MNASDMRPLVRRLSRRTVLKTHNISLDHASEFLLTRIKHILKGKEEHDVPSTSVVLRHALNRYGRHVLTLPDAALPQERKEVSTATYLPRKRKHHETA